MALTLQEAKVGMRDHIAAGVINEFQQDSLLLDKLVFDNAVAAGSSGSTLVYGYQQVQTPAVAGVRAINSEYTAGEAKRVEKTAKVIPMGGKFELDRIIIGTAGEVDELEFQTKMKVAATANEFHMLAVNGTAAASGAGYITSTFDGLKKLLAGTANEFTSEVDISSAEKMESNKQALLDELDKLIAYVPGCNMLLMNKEMLIKVRGVARRAGYWERSRDEFGRVVETYNGITMFDVGKYYNGVSEVDVIPTDDNGKTAIYAIAIGLDGFHGISPQGDKIVRTYMPDLNAPGAVKTGEVELIAGVALKNSKKAGVLKDIKVSGNS